MAENPKRSFHTSAYRKRHPDTADILPNKETTLSPKSMSGLEIFQRLIGPGFILGGIALMEINFSLAIVVVLLGFVLLIWELCVDPELVKRALWVQVALLGLCFAIMGIAAIALVRPNVPLQQTCYSPRKGEYAPGTIIAGIPWDSHLAELRVGLTNPTDDYYEMDLNIEPDRLVYKAAIIDSLGNCKLDPLGGNDGWSVTRTKGGQMKVAGNRIGNTTEIHNNLGDVFTPLLTGGGYRLICDKLPSKSTIELVFALATISNLVANAPQPPKDGMSIAATEIAGAKSEFDVLGPKPDPTEVVIKGHYKRTMAAIFG